jgi:FKBP-type peptidyl-prolyl cis-trans isomerase 2
MTRSSLSIFAVCAVVLSACTFPGVTVAPTSTGTTAVSTGTTVSTPSDTVQSGSLVSVDYTLRIDTADGKIMDTSREVDAKTMANYSTGRTYEPLSFVVGAGRMIKGFDAGVRGMKTGERKTIKVSAADGYGTGGSIQEIPMLSIAPVYTQVVDKMLIEDIVKETVDSATLGDKAKDVKVGASLEIGNGQSAKVLGVSASGVILAIENTANPFYKLPKTVGTKATQGDMMYEIKSITGTGVSVERTDKKNPFYNRFKVGEKATLPNKSIVEITAINTASDKVTISTTTELTGKTLFFDVQVVSIK